MFFIGIGIGIVFTLYSLCIVAATLYCLHGPHTTEYGGSIAPVVLS